MNKLIMGVTSFRTNKLCIIFKASNSKKMSIFYHCEMLIISRPLIGGSGIPEESERICVCGCNVRR